MQRHLLREIKKEAIKKYEAYLAAEEEFADHGRTLGDKPSFEKFIKAKSEFKNAESRWQEALLSYVYAEPQDEAEER